jgi:hypothetical protein
MCIYFLFGVWYVQVWHLAQNLLAMQLSAAPIDHRLAKFVLAWTVLYLCFGTFYTDPQNFVNPLVVAVSLTAAGTTATTAADTTPSDGIVLVGSDSARFVKDLFQRVGLYYLLLVGAVVSNWCVRNERWESTVVHSVPDALLSNNTNVAIRVGVTLAC